MKTIPFPGFTGKDSTPFSSKADVQALWNLYRETIQSGDGDNDYVLYKTAGLLNKLIPQVAKHRGGLELNDRLFEIVGNALYDIDETYTVNATYSPIVDDGRNVIFAADPETLCFVSGNILYAVNSGALTTPATPAVPISVAWLGYFVMLSASNQFFFSTGGLTWNALDFQTVEASANNVIAMIVDHEELWMVGNRITQPYVLTSDRDTPYQPRQDAVIQQGTAAAHSLVALDNSLFCLGRNRNGDRTVVRFEGYNPKTVSTYALSNTLRKYPRVDDCIGMAFQINGHSFAVFTFPSANGGIGATHAYDATENEWFRWESWNVTLGRYERHYANCITSAFGKILAGHHTDGRLFELDPDYLDDDGNPIRWLRRAPHVRKDNKNVQIGRFEVTAEVGVGLDG